MKPISEKENAVISVITKFHLLTGVYPTIDQLHTITGYSKKILNRAISSLVASGYWTEGNERNLDRRNS